MKRGRGYIFQNPNQIKKIQERHPLPFLKHKGRGGIYFEK
jgi:hypothetical protein